MERSVFRLSRADRRLASAHWKMQGRVADFATMRMGSRCGIKEVLRSRGGQYLTSSRLETLVEFQARRFLEGVCAISKAVGGDFPKEDSAQAELHGPFRFERD